MIQLIDYQIAKKLMLGETEPSCTMYICFYYDDEACRDTPRYIAIDAHDGKEIWVEDFAKLETAMLWLLDKELSAEDLRGAETVLLKSERSKNMGEEDKKYTAVFRFDDVEFLTTGDEINTAKDGGEKMDILEFMNESARLCNSMERCAECPLLGHCVFDKDTAADNAQIKKVIEIVEKWSKEHPVKNTVATVV